MADKVYVVFDDRGDDMDDTSVAVAAYSSRELAQAYIDKWDEDQNSPEDLAEDDGTWSSGISGEFHIEELELDPILTR